MAKALSLILLLASCLPSLYAGKAAERMACNIALALPERSTQVGGDKSTLQHFIAELPPKVQNLFSGALGHGHLLEPADLRAVGQFSVGVLSQMSKQRRLILYDLLNWDTNLRSTAERFIFLHKMSPILWADKGVSACAWLLWSSLAGFGAYKAHDELKKIGVALLLEFRGQGSDDMEKKYFAPLLSESDSQLYNDFKISTNLAQTPATVTIAGATFKRKFLIEVIPGVHKVLYELTAGESKVHQILISENNIKNVNDGYEVELYSDLGVTRTAKYDEKGMFRERSIAYEPSAPETIAAYFGKPGQYESLAPAPAKRIAKEPTTFDKAYSNEFRIKNSGVAVIDTGIDNSRSDLMSSVLWDKKTGYAGFDITLHSPVTQSWRTEYHGSEVSEVIAGASNSVKILPLKTDFSFPLFESNDHVPAIDQIRKWNKSHVDSPVRVINLSFVTGTITHDLIKMIGDNPDLVFVAGGGNTKDGGVGNHKFPSELNYPNLISVGAVDTSGNLAHFSAHGPNIDLVAQGVDLPLKNADGHIAPMSGTSFSAPKISALVAQIVLMRPNLTATQIKKLLTESVVPSNPRLDTATGGLIDEDRLFKSVLALP